MLHPIGIQASIILFRLLGFYREDNFFLSMLYVLIGLIASITLSVLSYHLLEKYFLDKRKYFSRR
jgi:peptidoglycan/LPS O-acetylase OafA/YrhL